MQQNTPSLKPEETILLSKILVLLESISERLPELSRPIPAQEVSEYFTIQEVAKVLNRKKQTIYGMTHRKQIPHFRRGKMLLFRKTEIHEWIEQTRRSTSEEIGANAVLAAGRAMRKKGGNK